MNGELKACPFCGSDRMTVYEDGVWCEQCSAHHDIDPPSRDRAIEAWNRRPIPAPGALPELPEPSRVASIVRKVALFNGGLIAEDLAKVEAFLANLDEAANRVYRLIPTLPVTADTLEEATRAMTQFCYDFQPLIRDVVDAAHAGGDDLAEVFSRCDWPTHKAFTVQDDIGEHTPCYVYMPDGGGLAFHHHAVNGVDQARADFVASACNAAMRAIANPKDSAPAGSGEVSGEMVEQCRAGVWLPIESAPKDGTFVLLGRDMGNFGFIRGTGYFEGSEGSFVSGWVSRGLSDPMGNLGLGNPSHWAPIPAALQSAFADDEGVKK